MGTRSKLGKMVVAAGLGLALLGGIVGPAAAAPGDTTATFTITAAGGLALTVPESKALGSAASGAASTTPAQLGAVTVADTRGSFLGSWTASVSSTDFVTDDYLTAERTERSADEVIDNINASYWSGLATASSGTAVRLPGQAAELNKATLDAAATAFSASAIVGNNSTTWNPTFAVALPADTVVGAYEGTVTHSVA